MRVAFLTTSFPRYFGDYAGVFVYDLARSLASKGAELTVLAPHDISSPSRESLDGIEVARFKYFVPAKYQSVAYGAGIPTNIRTSTAAKIQLLPFLASFLVHTAKVARECDIIHAHWIEPGLLGLFAKAVFSRPLVISVHRSNPLGLVGRRMNRLILRRADQVFYNSTYTMKACQELAQSDNGKVLPPGINTERFHSKWDHASNISANESAQENTKPTVLGVGSLVPVKGFIHLVEAIPFVLKHIDCNFVIAGQGPEHQRLIDRAEQLGVSQNVLLLGQVSTQDMPRIMREADVFVLPSIHHTSGDDESLGMVLVEALASGTPCIASNTGGTSDVVRHGIDGLLVSPGSVHELAQAIVELLRDANMREELGRAGRHRAVECFSIDVIAKETYQAYWALLDRQ